MKVKDKKKVEYLMAAINRGSLFQVMWSTSTL